jgi:serine/threonine protein kinase
VHKSIPLATAKIYLIEIAMALQFLHKHGIVYRDLKSENVMIDEAGHVKLIDFGLATQCTRCTKVCGTPEYLSPEMLANRPYGIQVDWWALGVLAFEMLFSRTPFYAVDRARMNEKISKRPVVIPQGADRNVRNLICGLLDKDPKYRFGFAEIEKHPLFEDVDFMEVLEKKVESGMKGMKVGEENRRRKLKGFGANRESFQTGDGTINARIAAPTRRTDEGENLFRFAR